MIIILSILLAVITTWAVVVTWKWVELGKTVLAVEDRLESAVDDLDAHEKRISSVLDVPLASDDPLVKRVIADIRSARKTIVQIASTLTDDFDEEITEDVVSDNVENK